MTELPSPELLTRWSSSALSIVAEARALLLARLDAGFETWAKPDSSYVTQVDLAVEELLRSRLAAAFPGHGMLGEEFGASESEAEFQWLLDPIDGTLSFTRGIPLFGTIVALHRQGRPLLGIIDHPLLNQCYSAILGQGSFCNGRRIHVGPVLAERQREVISLSDRAQFLRVGHAGLFDRLIQSHSYTRVYSDCFGHTLAARGAIGAAVDFGLHRWDVAASRILLEEAGGRYVELELPGTPYLGVLLGKPELVESLLQLAAGDPAWTL